MIYFIYGEDTYSARHALKKIKDGLGDQDALQNNTTILDGSKVTPDELRNYVQAMPFLGQYRLVIVEDLLKRLQAEKGKASKKNDDSLSLPVQFNSVMKNDICPTTVLVLTDGALSSSAKASAVTKALFDGISDINIKNFAPISENKLSEWIRSYVAENGGRISASAVEKLKYYLSSDLWALSNNIDKLLIYKNGQEITEKDIICMVPEIGQEKDIWTLLNATLSKDLKTAMNYYTRITGTGANGYYLLSMIVTQMRKVMRVKMWMEEGYTGAKLLSVTKLSSFQIKDPVAQAKGFSVSQLEGFYRKVLDADVKTKTGQMDPDTAVMVLISELCEA